MRARQQHSLEAAALCSLTSSTGEATKQVSRKLVERQERKREPAPERERAREREHALQHVEGASIHVVCVECGTLHVVVDVAAAAVRVFADAFFTRLDKRFFKNV